MIERDLSGVLQEIAFADIRTGTYTVYGTPDIGDITISEARRSTSEVPTTGDIRIIPGPVSKQRTIEVAQPRLEPYRGLFLDFKRELEDLANVWARLRSKEEDSIYDSGPGVAPTVAFATTGVATVSGAAAPDLSDDEQFAAGMIITSGGVSRLITEILTSSTAMVTPAPSGAVVAAGNFQIGWPRMQIGPVYCHRIMGAGLNMPVQGAYNSSLQLLTVGPMPDPVAVA